MKLPFFVVPASILAAAAGGIALSSLFSFPSTTIDFPWTGPAESDCRTVTLLVDGVRCVDTAKNAASALAELPGIRRFVAYASRARVEVTFEAGVVGRAEIVDAIEGPILDESTGEYRFGVYRVIEVDGLPRTR